MTPPRPRRRAHARPAVLIPVVAALVALVVQAPGGADPGAPGFGPPTPLIPGNLLVSTSVFPDNSGIVAGQTALPPGCSDPSPTNPNCQDAVADGTYPYVFNNDSVDGSFGITSKIVLDELNPFGWPIGLIEVPNSSQPGVTPSGDQMVTSFSSKSELALNLSTDGRYVTFMGYDAPVGTADVSNSSTPGDPDPTNPVVHSYSRVVAQLGQDGRFQFTQTNAYSGDNGRAAILNDEYGAHEYYAAGNAGNGASPEPTGVVLGAGAQLIQPSSAPEAAQTVGQPTPLGSFNVMQQLGYAKEKVAKDDNFRGLTISGNVVYYSKGSGSNGVDTVYFVDTTGAACPSGSGLPEPGAPLPSATLSENPSEGGPANPGLSPQNMCMLKGFPTASAKNATDASDYPFGLWFANPDTLYVADEGSGDNTYSATTGGALGQYTAAAASTTAGLQKWVYSAASGQWQLAYTLQSGLNLGQPYTVRGYPVGDNTVPGGSGLPWAPATDGLRNLTGRVNPNGTVSIWAVTSTVSGSGDQGADPDRLVEITDDLGTTTLPTHEDFSTLETAPAGSVLRGVSFTPGTTTRAW